MRIASIITARAGGIVGGARAAGPGIEMRAEHHHFVRFVRARNFRDDVEGIQILIVKLVGRC